MKKTILSLMLATNTLTALSQVSPTWEVKHQSWTPQHEELFSKFITDIGEAVTAKKCGTAVGCLLKPEINMFAKNHSQEFVAQLTRKFQTNRIAEENGEKATGAIVDCADLPSFLRTYFAYMNNLPMAIPGLMESNKMWDRLFKRDARYSKKGNRLKTIHNFGTGSNAVQNLLQVTWSISTRSFRLNPEFEVDGRPDLFDFTYSPAITREAIRPGTVVYDPAGHVAMVFKIEDDGRIRLIDAHPDNTISSITYGEKFMRSNPNIGAGFKAWRPVYVEGASIDARNNLRGGFRGYPNESIRDFSLEQYYGSTPNFNDWNKGTFTHNGIEVDYYDYVRRSLRLATYKVNPLQEFKNSLEEACTDVKERVHSVKIAVDAGIHLKPQPANMPENIYVTEGEWEEYATPSRDSRIRTVMQVLRRDTTKLYNEAVDVNGEDRVLFAQALNDAYNKIAKNDCKITYTNSVNQHVEISLHDVFNRATAISFNPYHCPELRWGATGNELATCQSDANKSAWYDAELRYRMRTSRDGNAKMGFSLKELQKLNRKDGIKKIEYTVEDVLRTLR